MRSGVPLPNIHDMPRLYDSDPGMSKIKYNHLQKLCKKSNPSVIPFYYHAFYNSLIASNADDEEF